MVSVLSGTNEVITHFLLLSPVNGILGTVRLGGKELKEKRR